MDDYDLTLPGDRPSDDSTADTPLFQSAPELPAAVGSGLRVGKRRGKIQDNRDPNTDPELGIPLPEPPPAPADGMTFGENVRGSHRTGTWAGVAMEATDLDQVRGKTGYDTPLDPVVDLGMFAGQGVYGIKSGEAGNVDPAETAAGHAQRKADAEDAFLDMLRYEKAPTRLTPSSVAGTLIGSALSPESLGGLSGLIARQFPKLAARPIVTGALDAAIMNTITDPVIQGMRLATGAQEEYDPVQTLLAPVVGAAVGGTVAGVTQGVKGVADNLRARAADDGIEIDENAVNRYVALRGHEERRQSFTPSYPDAPARTPGDTTGDTTPEARRVAIEARFGPIPTDRPFTAQVSAPEIREELGVDIPGTLLRGFALPETPGAPQGLAAFHGSPHEFDRFDLSKIGTGEGARAYGYGLYFAEAEGTARSYRDNLSASHVRFSHPTHGDNLSLDNVDNGLMAAARKGALRYDPDEAAAIPDATFETIGANITEALRMGDSLDDMARFVRQSDYPATEKAAWLAALEDGKTYGVEKPAGALYEVRLNAKPEQFLDWDKPLAEQPPAVRDALARLGIGETEDFPKLSPKIGGEPIPATKPIDGAEAYRQLGTDTEASAALREAGIVGIRYLDGASRRDGNGTSNFVVFDDGLIEIVAKNGVPTRTPGKLPEAIGGPGTASFGPSSTASPQPRAAQGAPKGGSTASPQAVDPANPFKNADGSWRPMHRGIWGPDQAGHYGHETFSDSPEVARGYAENVNDKTQFDDFVAGGGTPNPRVVNAEIHSEKPLIFDGSTKVA